jgi:hypothetical protein
MTFKNFNELKRKIAMEKILNRSTVRILIFTTGLILSFLSSCFPEARILTWGLMCISIIYLFLGWFLFKGYYPEGEPVLLFLMGYLYSGIFMSSAFASEDWPLAGVLAKASIVWATIQIVLIFILRKKIPVKGFVQFLIEAGLLVIMAVLIIAKG